MKKYLSAQLEDLQKEKLATDMYLNHHPKSKRVDQVLIGSDSLRDLLSYQFAPLSEELDNWSKSPYEHNLKHPEHLCHKVGPNEFVRSKSEAMISKVLRQNKIPYRYECKLVLDEIEMYPDFTIRHPTTGDVYYWEHFGLLDKPRYVERMHKRMQLYTANKIMPGINLITTYETEEVPLAFEMVEMLISYYFS